MNVFAPVLAVASVLSPLKEMKRFDEHRYRCTSYVRFSVNQLERRGWEFIHFDLVGGARQRGGRACACAPCEIARGD